MKRLLLALAFFLPSTTLAIDLAGYKITRLDGKIVFAESYENVDPFYRITDFERHTTLHHKKHIASIAPLGWRELAAEQRAATKDGSAWANPALLTGIAPAAREVELPKEGMCGAPLQHGGYCQTPVDDGGYCAIHAGKFLPKSEEAIPGARTTARTRARTYASTSPRVAARAPETASTGHFPRPKKPHYVRQPGFPPLDFSAMMGMGSAGGYAGDYMSSGMVHVNGYYRGNGTYVESYWRSPPSH